jgi:hypothetical protein
MLVLVKRDKTSGFQRRKVVVSSIIYTKNPVFISQTEVRCHYTTKFHPLISTTEHKSFLGIKGGISVEVALERTEVNKGAYNSIHIHTSASIIPSKERKRPRLCVRMSILLGL